ncbi:MAG: HAD hydrolase family protein [Lentisphaeria bacterium]|nr:HAD hydrolase family protein [Lentisphaeria bacterium]
MISSADFERITTLIFDIDGTLTDGRIGWDGGGNAVKFFHIRDTHWLKLALRAGLRVGVLSGRSDAANRRLAGEVRLSFALEDAKDKIAGFEDLLRTYGLTAAECLYAGDDVVDIPVMRRAGIGVAVADAAAEVAAEADWQTRAAGGCGAAAEIVRRVLSEKHLLDQVMERYRR